MLVTIHTQAHIRGAGNPVAGVKKKMFTLVHLAPMKSSDADDDGGDDDEDEDDDEP